jgi:hypothetical protein
MDTRIQPQKYPDLKNRPRYVFLEYLTRIQCVPDTGYAARLLYLSLHLCLRSLLFFLLNPNFYLLVLHTCVQINTTYPKLDIVNVH